MEDSTCDSDTAPTNCHRQQTSTPIHGSQVNTRSREELHTPLFSLDSSAGSFVPWSDTEDEQEMEAPEKVLENFVHTVHAAAF